MTTFASDPIILANRTTGDSGQFQWFSSIGATDEAVMVLNDQPVLFTILLVVLVTIIGQSVLLWYIGFATLKPEQIKAVKDKKKAAAEKKKKKSGGSGGGSGAKEFFPPALRR